MGIFSSSKKVYVASTVYKMVDDDTPRPAFMQEALTSAVIQGGPNTFLGESIVNAHLSGPRSSQRSFFRWAKANYDFGMPRASINYTTDVDLAVVAAHIHNTLLAGNTDLTVNISRSFVDISDESYFAEQYIFENRPELIDTEWVADFDQATSTINIVYPPGTEYPAGTPLVSDSISVPGFNSSDSILVAYYNVDHASTGENDPTQVFIYEMDSGVQALDSFTVKVTDGSDAREFYPPIPIRIDNVSVFASDSPAKGKEDEIRDAYKKSMGGEIDDLIDEIEDNEDIGDIDYAYVVQGVCLNDKTKAGKRYVFEFIKTLAELQQTTSTDYEAYETTNDAAGNQTRTTGGINGIISQVLNTAAQNAGAGNITNTETATQTRSQPVNEIHLTLPTGELGVLDMKITWSDVTEETVTGRMKQDSKRGDVEVFLGDSYTATVDVPIFGGKKIPMQTKVQAVSAAYQIKDSEYVLVSAKGLHHTNLIYGGKSVDITGEEALEDDEDSGFIFPLHEPTLRRMGLYAATEVARQSQLIVFNSYKVVKKKWYQKGIFKVFAIVVVITAIVVLAVVTGGASLGPSAPILGGVLGSSAAIGAALGFSGLLAIAIGTAVNVIAAMVITHLVSIAATAVLGEKLGGIIAAVVQVAMAIATGQIDLSSFSSNLASIGTMTNLMHLTDAAANITMAIQQDGLEKIQDKIENITDAHNEELDRLKEQWEAFGFGERVIDPLMLTDFTHMQMGESFTPNVNLMESVDDFIARTLMTGDDLIEMSMSFVNDFSDVSLTLQ